MSKKRPVTQSEYKVSAESTSELCGRASGKLSDIGRNLSRSADFSPCTIEAMRGMLSDLDTLRNALKVMVDLSVRRGCTHFDEQKDALMSGDLRLDRRSTDMAAE